MAAFDEICGVYDNINMLFYSICLKGVTMVPVSFSNLYVESSCAMRPCADITTSNSLTVPSCTGSLFFPGNGLKRRKISRSVSDGPIVSSPKRRRMEFVMHRTDRQPGLSPTKLSEPSPQKPSSAKKTPTVSKKSPPKHTNTDGSSGDGKWSVEEEMEEEVDFEDENIMKAVQRLQECLAEDNLESLMKVLTLEDGIAEKQLHVAIGVHLVQKLAGKAYANHSITGVKCPCGCSGSVPAGDMWIGSSETWHGELDLLGGDKTTSLFLRTVDADAEDADAEDAGAYESDGNRTNEENAYESDGNRTKVEIKKKVPMQGISRCQIFAQAIVFGWTEYNRHPDLCPNIPTLVVGNGKIIPYIYNPVTDELLTTRGYIDMLDKGFTKQHIVVIWALLHHRLFFSKNWIKQIHPSNFQAQLSDSLLDKYKSLISFKSKEIRPKTKDFYPQTSAIDCFIPNQLRLVQGLKKCQSI